MDIGRAVSTLVGGGALIPPTDDYGDIGTQPARPFCGAPSTARVGLDTSGDEQVRALEVAAFTSGTGPLLGWWIEQGLLDASGRVRALLEVHLDHGRTRAARMHLALREAAGALETADVRVTVLKGAHTAHTYFPEPGVRPMADLDLLVAEGDTARAERALRTAGYTLVPGSQLARPYRSDWRPSGAPATVRSLTVHHESNPYTVDLHGSLDVDFFGVRTIRFGAPAGTERVPAPWTSTRATALAPTLLVAYLAAHASQGLYNLTLIRLIELALLLRLEAQRDSFWDELAALLQRLRAERFVYPAFALVERLIPSAVEPAIMTRLTRAATPALRDVVARTTPATAQGLERIVLAERFMWAATPVEHLRRAAYMLVPTGLHGSARRLHRIYLDRAFRLLRGRISLRD